MNKKRLLIIARLLEMSAKKEAKPKFGFNMSSFVTRSQTDNTNHFCQTQACVAGWTVLAFTPGMNDMKLFAMGQGEIQEKAGDLLKLNDYEEALLFLPTHRTMGAYTPRQAAAVIRNFVKTGDIYWPPTRFDR